MSRSELAVLSCLRDSAQLSTLPAWCRGELSTAADLIDQLRQRVAEAERERDEAWLQAATWRDRANQAKELLDMREQAYEAKLALAEQLLRECVANREGLAYETELLARIDAAIDASQD